MLWLHDRHRQGRTHAGGRGRDCRWHRLPRHGGAASVPGVMPRSRKWILEHADELAAYFEDHEPGDERDVAEYMLRRAAIGQAESERRLTSAVTAAREAGWSWRRIGDVLGVSAQAAQQRYGTSA